MQDLIIFIEQNLSRKRLEEISASVINAYKTEDDFTLKTHAGALGIDTAGERKKLFYSLIQKLHPDRFPVIYSDYKKAKASSDIDALERIRRILELKLTAAAVKADRFEYRHEESWAAAPSGYSDDAYKDFDADAEVFEEESFGGGDFFAAVKNVIFGNHDFHVEPADLGQIDGSLDIGFFGLDDMGGIEYCRNVRILNISGNSISNIHDLQNLVQLEELYASGNAIRDIEILTGLEYLEIIDVSDNDIEDISSLLNMNALKFIDLRANPIQNRDVIEKLEADGVVVLR